MRKPISSRIIQTMIKRNVSVNRKEQFQIPNIIVKSPKILITGALGQLGMGLARELRAKYGSENVLATDIKKSSSKFIKEGPYLYLNVLNKDNLESIIVNHNIDWVIHFSALLSAIAEIKPKEALDLNMNSFQHVLEAARNHNLRIFLPSTIGAFGPSTPNIMTPDITIQKPNTIYGITKVHCELLGEYYFEKYGVDFRSARYPGIISADTPPGGGTTDYAVDIFHKAIKSQLFTSFLSPDTILPMMYLPDCIKGTIQLMETYPQFLKQRTYNMASFSFSPKQLYEKIILRLPNFQIQYKPDFRQKIADSWPQSLDDNLARQHWGWKNDFDLDMMIDDMLFKLTRNLKEDNFNN